MSDASALRIGTAERDAAAAALGEHFAAGRLTPDELDERLSRAVGARTGADLAPLFADLPTPHAPGPAAPVPVAGRRAGAVPPRALLALVVLLLVAVWVGVTHVPPFFLFPLVWFALARRARFAAGGYRHHRG